MYDTDTHYDFEEGVVREMRAAQVRLASAHVTHPAARRRRPSARTVTVAAAATLAAATATAAVTASGTTSSHAPVLAAPPPTAAFVTAKLSASLGSAGYMITSHVTEASTGEKMTSWIDPATGSRRLLLTSAAGTPEIAEGIVIRGAKATITTLDYATRTATTSTESATLIQDSPRLGVSVPTPAGIRRELASATLVRQGTADVAGRRAYKLRMVVPPPSQKWFPGDDVELYVSTGAYRLIRATISVRGTLLDTEDLTWTPRATADLARTRLTIPAGFTRR